MTLSFLIEKGEAMAVQEDSMVNCIPDPDNFGLVNCHWTPYGFFFPLVDVPSKGKAGELAGAIGGMGGFVAEAQMLPSSPM